MKNARAPSAFGEAKLSNNAVIMHKATFKEAMLEKEAQCMVKILYLIYPKKA